jgi:hypothetical protein
MRPVRGFERPVVQWLMMALSVALIAIAAWTAIALQRGSVMNEQLHAQLLQARLERQQIDARLVREQSAREALQLELARRRASESAPVQIPTLTLAPLTARGATPPQPIAAVIAPTQLVELRLELPRGDVRTLKSFTITARDWTSGATRWSRGHLLAQAVEGRTVVPALVTGDMLAPGSYELLLIGTSADGASRDVAAYEVSVRR